MTADRSGTQIRLSGSVTRRLGTVHPNRNALPSAAAILPAAILAAAILPGPSQPLVRLDHRGQPVRIGLRAIRGPVRVAGSHGPPVRRRDLGLTRPTRHTEDRVGIGTTIRPHGHGSSSANTGATRR